jgi:DNA-binding transcriptional MocR family regulator
VAPTALAMGERVVVLASLSKCHGAPGLRLGWVITRNLALRKQLILAKFNTVISCSAVDEALALRVLQQDEKSFALRRARLGEGRDATARWVEENGSWVEWVRPNAGAMCCVRLRREAFDQAGVQRFYRSLAEAGARVANGEWFGEEPRIFRLGFGLLALPQLQAALATAGQALQRAVGSHSPVEGPAVFMG